MNYALAVGLAVAALASSARAQDLIAVKYSGSVYSLNSATGNGTLIGFSGHIDLNAMARRSDGRLFVGGGSSTSSTSSIYEIDPSTGLGTLVVNLPMSNIRALAFDPADVLYAIHHQGPAGSLNDLYTIDLTLGTATLIGSTGYPGIQGMTFAGSTLYGWEVGAGGGSGVGLITIDPSTGAGNDVNPAIGGLANDVQTLAYTSSSGGQLFGAKEKLYSVDMATGSLALMGNGGYSDLRGMEFLIDGLTMFCLSKKSSLQCTPSLWTGTTTASKSGAPAAILTAAPVPGGPGLPGILIYAKTPPAFPVQTSFGLLCLSGFARLGAFPSAPGGTTSSCNGAYSWDIAAIAAGTPAIAIGDALRIQAWYRDPGYAPPENANFTNGIDALTIVP
jgi:hypothetical protein